MPNNKATVADAFAAWSNGTGHITSIFAEEMTWEIVGESAASKTYPNARAFINEVLQPFGKRFRTDAPFRPVRVRGIFGDGDTVIVFWEGEGTTVAHTLYANTYAWFLRLRNGKVIDGVAFYDSIAFNRLWNGIAPS